MRLKRSTVVVFVVVAVAWFVLHVAAWHAFADAVDDPRRWGTSDEGKPVPDYLLSTLYDTATVMFLPLYPLYVGSGGSLILDDMLWSPEHVNESQVKLFQAINAVAGATLLTAVFVLVRRVRERHAASKLV